MEYIKIIEIMLYAVTAIYAVIVIVFSAKTIKSSKELQKAKESQEENEPLIGDDQIMEIENDPIKAIIEAFKEIYGNTNNIKIQYNPHEFEPDSEKIGSCNQFEGVFYIDLSPYINIMEIAAVLAHELAHTIYFDHGPKWEKCFNEIKSTAEKKIKKKALQEDEK